MKSHTEHFNEHADDYGWSIKEQRDILLKIIEEELKWNIFVGHLSDYYPLSTWFDDEDAESPEEKRLTKERKEKASAAMCCLVFPKEQASSDDKPVAVYYFPTSFPEMISKMKEDLNPGSYIMYMGNKDKKPIQYDNGDFVMRKELNI